MTKLQKSSFIKLVVCMLLVISFVLPSGLASVTATAAEKPSIASAMHIGLGSIYSENYGYNKSYKYELEVDNPVKKATYSFTSSNKKVVTVKSSGTKATLTGVKAGTATITCNQKLNGKTTKVGTCKVTVNNSKVSLDLYDPLPVGTGEGFFIYWNYRNDDAKYTFTSDSKDFTLKLKEGKDEQFTTVYQTYTAKKAGKYTVTVKETYNKKERTVGKLKFEVKKATVNSTAEVYMGDTFWAFDMINYGRNDCSYLFDFGEDGIVDIYNEDGTVYVKGTNVGTVTVKIYEDATELDESKLIGTCKVTVKELKIENLEYYIYSNNTYVGDTDAGGEVFKIPYNAPEAISVTSSDPSIATIKGDSDFSYFTIVPVSEGTVTITITCGEFTKTETVTVYKNEDAMYGYDDEEDDYEDEEDDY